MSQYAKAPRPVANESREQLLYRLLVQTLIRVEERTEREEGFNLRDVLNRDTIRWWRIEKSNAQSEVMVREHEERNIRRVASVLDKLSDGEKEILKLEFNRREREGKGEKVGIVDPRHSEVSPMFDKHDEGSAKEEAAVDRTTTG
jgi:hypothetical protein